MKVTLLGAGVPTPTPRRFGSAYLLDVAARSILIDCGPSTTHKLTKAGRSAVDVSLLLFTHHHFDHNADYPCFVLTRWDQDIAQTPLRVYGPPPTTSLTRKLFAAPDGAYVCDWNARVEHPGSQRVFANRGGTLPRAEPNIEVADIDATFVLEEPDFTVRAAETVHVQPYLESVAYRIDSEHGSIVFSGDTEPVDGVVELARGADTLICMCWDRDSAMAADGLDHGMTGTASAGRMAAAAGVRTLVLTHIGAHLDSPGVREEGIKDVAAVFDDQIIFGEELQQLDVARPHGRAGG
jgi:ribonuclease BN (tRNA processing enzyme)